MGVPAVQEPIVTSAMIQSSTLLNSTEKAYVAQLISLGVDVFKALGGVHPATATTGLWYGYGARYGVGTVSSGYTGNNLLDGAKAFYSKNPSFGDFDTLLINALKSNGISVDVGTGNVTVIAPLQSPAIAGASLESAIKSGTGIQAAAAGMLSQLNMGQYDNPGAASFFSNPDNNTAIQQAYSVMGYGVPTTTDVVGVSTMLKLYWGAYYLNEYPIPPSSPNSCNQIKESIEQLTTERANISDNITHMAANPADEFYGNYSSQDLEFQSVVVSDLLNKFNGLSAKNACTSVITSGGGGGGASNPSSASNISLILLLAAIVGIVYVAHKIITKKSDN